MTFALMLDIVIAFLLAGTIFYIWQLSSQLARFRQNRSEMDRFIRELSTTIERANLAIAGMRAAAETSGDELHKRTRAATEISDELQLMIESANNMATRLERAASTVSASVIENQNAAMAAQSSPSAPKPYIPPQAPRRDDATAPAFPAFAIRDPEFDPDRKNTPSDKDSSFEDEFESESERELFRALQNRRP